MFDVIFVKAECRPIRLLDWSPKPVVKPNRQLLSKLRAKKRKQSRISRERQAFIGITHTSAEELKARHLYTEEWLIRISENSW